jgi:acyl-CoA ligase (AMP-forming) (exosortase A-associated)
VTVISSAGPGGRIDDILAEAAHEAPDTLGVIGDRLLTWGALDAEAGVLACGLSRMGVRPGDRVAVFLDKTTDCVAALYGAWRAGAVVVPVNESLRARQVEHIVANSGAVCIISSARKIRLLGSDATIGARVVTVDELAAATAVAPSPGGGGPEAAAILYTSGSTGRPKGILLTHDNLRAGTRIVTRYLGLRGDDRILSVLPFSFDYGLNQLLTAVASRAAIVLQRSSLPAEICRTMERERITVLAGVPPLWIQLLSDVSPLARMALPSWRLMTNSGGAFPPDLVREYRSTFPQVELVLMYGLSEAFRSTYLPSTEVDRRPTSMGRAIPECEILVLDLDGRRCGPGEVGELVHRGPTVAAGYWDDPDTTARVFRPDPEIPGGTVVHSGDLVRADDDGFLYFVGRRDELIKSQGYRISPTEVEEIAYASGLVREALAAGEPDPLAGQVVVLHVVPLDPDTFDADTLLDVCRDQMPRYMVPRRVVTSAAFPRTASGKIDRKAVTAGEPATVP